MSWSSQEEFIFHLNLLACSGIYRRHFANATGVSKTGLITFLQTCSSSSSPRNFSSCHHWGQLPKIETLSPCWLLSFSHIGSECLGQHPVIQMSLPSSSKCVTLPMSPYTFRFHGTFALLPYLTVMGLMTCLLFHLSHCYKNDSTKTLWLKAITFYYYFSQFYGFTGLS